MRDLRNAKGGKHLRIVFLAMLSFWTSAAWGIPSNPVPYISGISPVSVSPGGTDFTLTVNGVNFVSASTVSWGTAALTTTYVSARRLTATVPASLTTGGGTGWITVSSPAPGGGKSNVLYLPVASPLSTIQVATFSSTVGNAPIQLSASDFDGDGMLDLAVSNFSDNTISILLGQGDGTFQTQTTYAVGSLPFGIAVQDLNGDGHLDLVVGNDSSSGISVLLGNGDGTFQAATTIVSTDCPLNPVLADVDADGYWDIVVSSYCDTFIYFYKGNGDGSFQAATSTSASSIYQIAVVDLNEDGMLDIAATHQDTTNTLQVLLGNGDGTFQAALISTPAAFAWAIAAADLNDDDHMDLVISTEGGAGIVSVLGNGDGTFQAAQSLVATGSFEAVTLGDLNADGQLDTIAVGGSTAKAWFGNGDGTFQAAQTIGGVIFTYGVVLGNFATNGGLGVAAGGTNTTVQVFLQTLTISPASSDFGSIGSGVASAPQVFTVTNSTANTVTISGISLTGTNPGDFSQTNTCSSPLVPGATCTASVTFIPAATGARSASLSIASNAPGSPNSAALTGTGIAVPPATATLSSSSIVFSGQVSGITSAGQSVTLTNSGSVALAINSILVTGANSGEFAAMDNCGSSLAGSAFCTISVTFTPAAPGTRDAAITVTDSAAGSPHSFSLQGTGQDFAFSISSADPVVAGNTATLQLTLSSLNGFNQLITFACTGAPALSTCTVTPDSVTPSQATTDLTVTLTTTGSALAAPPRDSPPASFPPPPLPLLVSIAIAATLALMAACFNAAGLRRLRPATWALGTLLLAASMGLAACGGATQTPAVPDPAPATPAGVHTLTVTATSGSLTHSTDIQVTVQ